jgi:hypothetical protein
MAAQRLHMERGPQTTRSAAAGVCSGHRLDRRTWWSRITTGALASPEFHWRVAASRRHDRAAEAADRAYLRG